MRKKWKKIEHWIVILIIVFTIGAPLVARVFADELGLLPRGHSGAADDPPEYPPGFRC